MQVKEAECKTAFCTCAISRAQCLRHLAPTRVPCSLPSQVLNCQSLATLRGVLRSPHDFCAETLPWLGADLVRPTVGAETELNKVDCKILKEPDRPQDPSETMVCNVPHPLLRVIKQTGPLWTSSIKAREARWRGRRKPQGPPPLNTCKVLAARGIRRESVGHPFRKTHTMSYSNGQS